MLLPSASSGTSCTMTARPRPPQPRLPLGAHVLADSGVDHRVELRRAMSAKTISASFARSSDPSRTRLDRKSPAILARPGVPGLMTARAALSRRGERAVRGEPPADLALARSDPPVRPPRSMALPSPGHHTRRQVRFGGPLEQERISFGAIAGPSPACGLIHAVIACRREKLVAMANVGELKIPSGRVAQPAGSS